MTCSTKDNCFNADLYCHVCFIEEPRSNTSYYKPIDKKILNEKIEERRKAHKRAEKDKKKAAKTSDISKRNKSASEAENKAIKKAGAKPTVNSGRKNRDADGKTKTFTIDHKLQSKTENPTINVHELDKVRAQAAVDGQRIGILIITNKGGRMFVVADLEDNAIEF